MGSPRFTSIDDYLSSLAPAKAKTLGAIIDLILAEFPELVAGIAWNVPTIRRNNEYVAGICAYKRHLTFSPWSDWAMEDFKARLEGLVVLKKCFQIPVDWEIDRKLVTDLIQARLAELDRSPP